MLAIYNSYLLTILLSIPLNKLPWLKSLLHSLQKGPRHGHQKSQHQKFQIMRLKATKKKVPTMTVDPVKKGFCFGRILIKVSEFVGKYIKSTLNFGAKNGISARN